MRTPSIFKKKQGISLIELLVALTIFGISIGAVYRLFIVQSKAYTVQDQAVEVQQNVRSAMEVLLRDLRMTGYDDDSAASNFTVSPAIANFSGSNITVQYEYYNAAANRYELHAVSYSLAGGTNLIRSWTVTPALGAQFKYPDETILENVDALTFSYGVDTDGSGAVNKWVSPAGIGTSKIIGIRATLTARPDQTNIDVKQRISPRTLTSAVILRNLIIK